MSRPASAHSFARSFARSFAHSFAQQLARRIDNGSTLVTAAMRARLQPSA